jgi:cell division protein ZapA (FtsZ GTPase activity inhibitor)
MTKVSIKVIIAGKSYSLALNADEQENALKASKLIEDKIKDLEKNYGVRDKQDLLAMCALQFANEIVKTQALNNNEQLDGELSSIESLLDGYLKKV